MSRGRPPGKSGELPHVLDIEPTRPFTTDDERDSWRRWRGVLEQTRPFLSTDAPLLTFVVELDMRKIHAMRALENEGHYIGGRRHPALTDLDNAHRDQMALLRELGLTAASAKNVKATRRTADTDALASFMNDEATKNERVKA